MKHILRGVKSTTGIVFDWTEAFSSPLVRGQDCTGYQMRMAIEEAEAFNKLSRLGWKGYLWMPDKLMSERQQMLRDLYHGDTRNERS